MDFLVVIACVALSWVSPIVALGELSLIFTRDMSAVSWWDCVTFLLGCVFCISIPYWVPKIFRIVEERYHPINVSSNYKLHFEVPKQSILLGVASAILIRLSPEMREFWSMAMILLIVVMVLCVRILCYCLTVQKEEPGSKRKGFQFRHQWRHRKSKADSTTPNDSTKTEQSPNKTKIVHVPVRRSVEFNPTTGRREQFIILEPIEVPESESGQSSTTSAQSPSESSPEREPTFSEQSPGG